MIIKLAIRIMLSLAFILVSHGSIGYEASEQDFERWGKNWDRLIPPGTYDFYPMDIDFNLMFDPVFQARLEAAGTLINHAVDGESIELAGFMVPTQIIEDKVTQFLLVPEAGQCIHVPPPPVNQTVLVDAGKFPIPLRSPFEPVIVSGRIVVMQQTNQLAFTKYEEITEPQQSIFEAAESGYILIDIKFAPLDLEG